MTYLLSVDPGKSTGVTLWIVPDDSPAERVAAWQFGEGLTGFLRWADEYIDTEDRDAYNDKPNYILFRDVDSDLFIDESDLVVISERFTPLQNQGFALTQGAVEPLRIEGAMVALGMIPHYDQAPGRWQRPAQMYLYGGTSLAERKKRARAWLKERGMLLTGKDVNAPDADDANSSQWHALAWLRKNHRPTLAHYWKED